MNKTELTKTFLEKTLKYVFDRDKSYYKKEVVSFIKTFLDEFVSKAQYEKTKNSRQKWESKYKALYKEYSDIRKSQEILGLVGKIK